MHGGPRHLLGVYTTTSYNKDTTNFCVILFELHEAGDVPGSGVEAAVGEVGGETPNMSSLFKHQANIPSLAKYFTSILGARESHKRLQ